MRATCRAGRLQHDRLLARTPALGSGPGGGVPGSQLLEPLQAGGGRPRRAALVCSGLFPQLWSAGSSAVSHILHATAAAMPILNTRLHMKRTAVLFSVAHLFSWTLQGCGKGSLLVSYTQGTPVLVANALHSLSADTCAPSTRHALPLPAGLRYLRPAPVVPDPPGAGRRSAAQRGGGEGGGDLLPAADEPGVGPLRFYRWVTAKWQSS